MCGDCQAIRSDIDRLIQQAMAAGLGEGRSWNMSVIPYTAAAHVVLEKNVFALLVGNRGDTLATANGFPLFPSAAPATSAGDTIVFAAHQMDIYKGRLDIAFSGAGVAPQVFVIQFFYTGRSVKIKGV